MGFEKGCQSHENRRQEELARLDLKKNCYASEKKHVRAPYLSQECENEGD